MRIKIERDIICATLANVSGFPHNVDGMATIQLQLKSQQEVR
jgi:hypothetical protein